MALEALHWHTPASVLLGLPQSCTKVTSVPLAFNERVRDYASLPLPFFLRRSRLLLPLSEGFRNIPPHRVRFRTVVKPVLFCAFLHLTSLTLTDVRPSNVEQSFFCVQPPSKKIFLATLRCFSVQFSFTFFLKRANLGSSHAPSFNSSYSSLAAHFFQYTDRALCTNIYLTLFGHTYLMSIVISSLKTSVCQCGRLVP